MITANKTLTLSCTSQLYYVSESSSSARRRSSHAAAARFFPLSRLTGDPLVREFGAPPLSGFSTSLARSISSKPLGRSTHFFFFMIKALLRRPPLPLPSLSFILPLLSLLCVCCLGHILYLSNRRVKRGLFPSSESFKSAEPCGRSAPQKQTERVFIIYSAPQMNSLLYAYSNGMFTSCSEPNAEPDEAPSVTQPPPLSLQLP